MEMYLENGKCPTALYDTRQTTLTLINNSLETFCIYEIQIQYERVKVGNDLEMAQSERNSRKMQTG